MIFLRQVKGPYFQFLRFLSLVAGTMASTSNNSIPSWSNSSWSWDSDDIKDADFLRFHRTYPVVRDQALANISAERRTDEGTLIKVEERIVDRTVEIFKFPRSTANVRSAFHPNLVQLSCVCCATTFSP